MKPGQPSLIEAVLPFIFLFGVMYFLIIRPQQKRAKSHEKLIAELKRGDQVVTSSGILGSIDGLTDHFATLDVGDGVKMKILRKHIAGSQAALMQDTSKKA